MKIKKISVREYLKSEGLQTFRNVVVPYSEKESFQFSIDFFDVETGEVFSFLGTDGSDEIFATNEVSFQAYQKNLIIATEI